jgi:integrase/recombinase XerD
MNQVIESTNVTDHPSPNIDSFFNYYPIHPSLKFIKGTTSTLSDQRITRPHVLDVLTYKLSSQNLPGKKEIEDYLRYQHRRNCRPNTIRNTFQGLESFMIFMKKLGKNNLLEMEKRDLEAFVEHEQDRGLKLSTVGMRLKILKAFIHYLIEQGKLGEEVFPWKLTIKEPEKLPRAMDPDDVTLLLALDDKIRDRAMILLLLRTGMRIGELLNTRMSDINIKEKKILIYEGEKNYIGRVVYFSEDAKVALDAWLKERNQKVEFLFYGPKGKALGYPAARIAFIKYLEKAGLSHKGYTMHCLRHTYATDLLNAGMPLECLSKLLGHTSLEVTRRYARLSDKSREEAYFKAMKIIERGEKNDPYKCDRELQALFEKTQLLPSYSEELHEST